MSPEREFEESASTDELIQNLWASVNRSAWHGMSCRCCGGGALFLDQRSFEELLLEYLADKYESDGTALLKDILQQRAQDSTVGFTTWLIRLGVDGTVPTPLVAKLKQDVVNTLQTMQAPGSLGYKG